MVTISVWSVALGRSSSLGQGRAGGERVVGVHKGLFSFINYWPLQKTSLSLFHKYCKTALLIFFFSNTTTTKWKKSVFWSVLKTQCVVTQKKKKEHKSDWVCSVPGRLQVGPPKCVSPIEVNLIKALKPWSTTPTGPTGEIHTCTCILYVSQKDTGIWKSSYSTVSNMTR